jgi:uncharacterized repeat protein (TIGR03803 family)
MTVRYRNLVTEIFLRGVLAFALGFVAVVGTFSAQAQTYKDTVLYTFNGGAHGGYPFGGLIFDAKGNLYGVTGAGGSVQGGIAYQLNTKRKETALYSFPGNSGPSGNLILDTKGNFYGVTERGGSGYGTVFMLSSKGKATVLYSFTGGADGAYPFIGLMLDAKGNLYGTTTAGGNTSANGGVVFKVDPTTKKETVLYTFCPGGFGHCTDGYYPLAGVIMDAKGNLYGTAAFGGNLSDCSGGGCGVVFKLSSKGEETVLYSFTAGTDGGYPYEGLIFDAKGNLYGTTAQGGDLSDCSGRGCGVVFKLSSKGKETVLHSFTGADGAQPNNGGLIFDAKGNLYGTTTHGGASSFGVAFKLAPNSGGTWTETVLHSFTGRADGAAPFGSLILDAKGDLYGAAELGGTSDFGVVFKLTP